MLNESSGHGSNSASGRTDSWPACAGISDDDLSWLKKPSMVFMGGGAIEVLETVPEGL